VRRICEAEAAAHELAVLALAETEHTRVEAEAEANRRRIEDEHARVLAERADLEARVQAMDATAAELARKVDETKRARDQARLASDGTVQADGERAAGEPAVSAREETSGWADSYFGSGKGKKGKKAAGKFAFSGSD
jgi:hypothetical protein